jgi:hypothetical protein
VIASVKAPLEIVLVAEKASRDAQTWRSKMKIASTGDAKAKVYWFEPSDIGDDQQQLRL